MKTYQQIIFGIALVVCIAGCGDETKKSALRGLSQCMAASAGEHSAVIKAATNVDVLPELGSSAPTLHFYKFVLHNQICILTATTAQQGIVTINSRYPWPDFVGKPIVFEYFPQALVDWPFTVFDANRECLPATSADVEKIAKAPMPSVL